LDCIIARSKEEEFGILIVETDRAGGKEGENSRNGEDGVKRCSVKVGTLSDNRGPMEKAIS